MSEDKNTAEEQVEEISFAQEVWDTLSRIDITDHAGWLPKTDKRPAVAYLPWHKAWTLLKREFPASQYAHEDDIMHPDETVEVGVRVRISDNGQDEQYSNARLAVMDSWFNPIKNPSARQRNDARQRVLVKALAFAGLGLDLWSDDPIPVGTLGDPISEKDAETITKLVEKSDTNEESFLKWCGVDAIDQIPNERFKSARSLLEAKLVRKQKGES